MLNNTYTNIMNSDPHNVRYIIEKIDDKIDDLKHIKKEIKSKNCELKERLIEINDIESYPDRREMNSSILQTIDIQAYEVELKKLESLIETYKTKYESKTT